MLPLVTDRLVIRMYRAADAPTLTRYRNDPSVARFQDWATPYPRHAADQLALDQADSSGPAAGIWVQLAVTRHGDLVGDLAVGLDQTGTVARLGFTIAHEHQSRGYAREAVTAVIGALMARGVLRVEADARAANTPSIRLLRGLGFVPEGPATVEDVVRYGLMTADWPTTSPRPTGCATS